MIAQYRCWSCDFAWETRVEGGSLPLKYPHSDKCPACGYEYFEWENYDKTAPRPPKRPKIEVATRAADTYLAKKR